MVDRFAGRRELKAYLHGRGRGVVEKMTGQGKDKEPLDTTQEPLAMVHATENDVQAQQPGQ